MEKMKGTLCNGGLSGVEVHLCFSQMSKARFANLYPKAARGFTLLELLVVMVIIGLLVGYVGPRYFAQIGKSEVKAALAQIDGFEKALQQYRIDTGKFPSNEQGLSALFVRPATEPRWQGPYLTKMPPTDPWGNPYVYRTPGENSDFDIVSLGKDGAPGGEGDAADVSK